MNPHATEQIKSSIENFHLPRYHEIPDIGLYLEQTVRYINDYLPSLTKDNITASMVSNYVKRGVLSNPIKKQYSREQIAYLIYITAVKSVLSMDDIKLTLRIQQKSYAPSRAYDYFCCEFENMLKYTFGLKEAPDAIGTENTEEKTILRNIITATTHAVYLNRLFAALHEQENPPTNH